MNRLEALLDAMTIEEKVGQLNMAASFRAVTGPSVDEVVDASIRNGRIGSLLNIWGSEEVTRVQRLAVEESRLGVPLLLCHDIIHGHRTIFPIPLAEACAFDPLLWEKTAHAAAQEACEEGITLTFAPMLDIARDARWGRMAESPGEDTWVAAQLAIAKIRGFQGEDLTRRQSLAATAKHFGAYGAVTAGREYASAEVSERTLLQVYLPPFAAAITAGVVAIMPAFNDIAGLPMTANSHLLRDILRERLGFKGVVISDYNAVGELLNHGVAQDLTEAAVLAFNAGVDIDMTSNAYSECLPQAIERGLISLQEIDNSVRRVLRLKELLGLFDDPFRRGGVISPTAKDNKVPHRLLARETAQGAIVLLTNKKQLLPLSPDLTCLAMIGPFADNADAMLGSWASAGHEEKTVSFFEGIKTALPNCRINFASGVDALEMDIAGIDNALDACLGAQIILLCLGETAQMSGEAASRADIGLPGPQRALAEAVLGLGKPVVVMLTSGRPLTAPWLFESADAVLATWQLGSEAGHAVADILLGKVNPSGKLPVSWPREVGPAPIFYSQRATGRPTQLGVHYSSCYIDTPSTPQFTFGHGLSYCTFSLLDFTCSTPFVRKNETIEFCVRLRNEGPLAGVATVFFFIHDLVASVARPLLELKGLKKIFLAQDTEGTISWSLPVEDLAFVGRELDLVLEAGSFDFYVGQSADPDGLMKQTVKLTL
jgi:beta-glucosidase